MSVGCHILTATQRLGHRYLSDMMKELKDTKQKYHGFKGIFHVDKFRDAIQAYEKRVNDLKMDFLVRVSPIFRGEDLGLVCCRSRSRATACWRLHTCSMS